MNKRAVGKYLIVPIFWLVSAGLIGYTSIITVLPGLVTLNVKRPGWIILGIAAGAEFFSVWQAGVATIVIMIPWLAASLIRPVIDVSFRFLVWCWVVVLLQLAGIVVGEFNIFFEGRGLAQEFAAVIGHLPGRYLAWVCVVSVGMVFGGAIWKHFNYPEAA